MATPAAAGGVVVGDPLDSASNPAAVMHAQGPRPTPPAAAPPAAPLTFGVGAGEEATSRRDDGDEDLPTARTPANAPIAGAGQPGTPQLGQPFAPGGQPGQPVPGLPIPAAGQPGVPVPGVPVAGVPNPAGSGSGKRDKKDKGNSSGGPNNDARFIDEDGPVTVAPPAAGAAPFAGNAPQGLIPGVPFGAASRFEDSDDAPAGGFGAGAAAEIVIKRDNAADAAQSFLDLLAAGDVERAKTLIAPQASGVLAKLRDGTIEEEETGELQTAAAARQAVSNRPKGGRHMLFTYNSDKQILILEVLQKEGESAVVKLDLREAPRRRR